MNRVDWKGGFAFEATLPSGISFVMDSTPDHGGQGLGPSPLETMVSALAACSAMDVITILLKKQQKVTAYRVEVTTERVPEGEFPRPITSFTVNHIVSGENIDPEAVRRSVELSDTKYCSVIATLRSSPTIVSRFEIE